MFDMINLKYKERQSNMYYYSGIPRCFVNRICRNRPILFSGVKYAIQNKILCVSPSIDRRYMSTRVRVYGASTISLNHITKCNMREYYPLFLEDLKDYLKNRGVGDLSINNIVSSFGRAFQAILSFNDYILLINKLLPYIKPEYVTSYILPEYNMTRQNAILLLTRMGFQNAGDSSLSQNLLWDIDRSKLV